MDDGDQSISKKRKMDNQSVDDLLSDLPVSIIHCILARIPIRDAVRTCVLSSKWRNEIREIILATRCHTVRRPLLVHSCLYSCQKLTHLELSGCKLRPPPPTFKGFSFLRSLSLYYVDLDSTSLESLIAKSPLLERFTYYPLTRVRDPELRISAPKLKYIHLSSDLKEISLCAPFVAEVFVRKTASLSPAEKLQQKSPVSTYKKFFGGFTNLERLAAKCFFIEYLSIGIESYDHSLVFHRLKSIRLSEVDFTDKKQLAVVGHLIMGAPNLHELKITICTDFASGSTANSFSDFGCLPNFTFKKLRVVKIKHVSGLPCETEFIKYLLKSSPRLQMMDLGSRSELLSEAGLNLATKVLSYCRASPNAAIFLLEPPSYLFDL